VGLHRAKNTPYRHAELDRRKQIKIDNFESFRERSRDVLFTSNTDPKRRTVRLGPARLLFSFNEESMHNVSVTTRELSSISERRRLPSPAITPQALTWHRNALWMGSRDLRRIYGIDVDTWTVFKETEAPGIPWAAVSTADVLRFTIGEGPEDDRYIREYVPETGFSKTDRIACPEFTGSYISFDGDHLYLSQWYKHRILKLDASGNILRVIDVGAEICGHVFVDGLIYVLRGREQPNEDWRIARLDPRQGTPEVKDIEVVPFACRSLTFDGANFWTNHRAANEIVSFALPDWH
jgi:hypothetical protein